MDIDGARALLESLKPDAPRYVSEVGVKGDAAYLHVVGQAYPERWGVVSSPGDRWFSVEIDGGFSLDHFEEETSDIDAAALLQAYVEIALAYLDNGAKHDRKRSVFPVARVATGSGVVELRRSLAANLRHLMRGRR